MRKYIPTSTVAEIESFTDAAVKSMEETEKVLKKAQQGMDITEARTLARTLGKDLNSFRYENGKWFYDAYEDIIDVYVKEDADLWEQIQNRATQEKEIFTNAPKEIQIRKRDISGEVRDTDRPWKDWK